MDPTFSVAGGMSRLWGETNRPTRRHGRRHELESLAEDPGVQLGLLRHRAALLKPVVEADGPVAAVDEDPRPVAGLEADEAEAARLSPRNCGRGTESAPLPNYGCPDLRDTREPTMVTTACGWLPENCVPKWLSSREPGHALPGKFRIP